MYCSFLGVQGTNARVQLRKLYNPWQFPNATMLGLFNTTYGVDRRHVCAFGIEANPVHNEYLTTLNAYFGNRSYQAIVIKLRLRLGSGRIYQDRYCYLPPGSQ